MMTLKVFITAGEASGDVLGARLMTALRAQYGGAVEFAGVGGSLMAGEGMESLFPIEDLSVMGIAEVLPRLPLILRRIRQTAEAVTAYMPDIFVSIDSPDFSFRVAKAIREQDGPRPVMAHYVAPTVWAWRPERAAKVAGLYDGILCLLPFEPPYFEAEGMAAAFTGHPMIESGLMHASGRAFRARHNIAPDVPVLGVFFGSRMGELNRMGPILRAAALRLAKDNPDMQIVSPTLPHLYRDVRNLLQKMPCPVMFTADAAEKYEAFKAMNFAVATSGTVGLELAVADVPHIIAYKLSGLSYRMVKKKMNPDVKYAHLANILLDQPAVPEFIQDQCKPDQMAAALRDLRANGKGAAQRQHFARVRNLIAGTGDAAPSQQAAEFVLSLCNGKENGRADCKAAGGR